MSVSGGVVHLNPPLTYYLNDFQSGDTLYIGKSAGGTTWLVQRYGTTSGVMLYATQENNPSVTTYASAWTNRVTLQYDQYQVVGF